MASYGGVDIFGKAVSITQSERPRETQVNSYFGINGLEFLDGGSRGRMSEVSGVLFGATITLLHTAESTFRGKADGVARDLIDHSGSIWSNVVLEEFQPIGRVRRSQNGLFFRNYRARFLHLV